MNKPLRKLNTQIMIDKEIIKILSTNSTDIKESLSTIINYINDQEEEIDDYRQQLREYNKDTEIQKLQNKLDYIYQNCVSILNDKEKESAEVFSRAHYETCKGDIRYIVEPTGIGDIIKVQCTKCGKIEDITDNSDW